MKPGHSLRDIAAFSPELLARLRDRLSVTTAEEFVGMWRVAREHLTHLIGDSARANFLAGEAQKVIPASTMTGLREAESRTFATGLDLPPGGQKTY